MSKSNNSTLIIKILGIGLLLTAIAYAFHPEAEHFSLMLNGQPVATPFLKIAAIPTLFIAMLLIGILLILAFLGAGMLFFIIAVLCVMLGFVFIAPYIWPFLVIIFVIIFLMSLGHKQNHS